MSKIKNISKRNLLIIVVIALILSKFVLNIAMTKVGEETNYSSTEALAILEEAKEIQVCKNYRTIFYKDYSIIVDGKNVAKVTGKAFHLFGNTFTMYSSDGTVMMSEKEEVLHLNRQAQFYDAGGNRIGRFESKYITILNKDTYKDNDGNFVARCDQKFSIPSKYVIHGEDVDDVFININKQLFFDNYTLTVKKESSLENITAVMMTCIEDAVNNSSSDSGSSSSNSKK